jgi:hypothetical protein
VTTGNSDSFSSASTKTLPVATVAALAVTGTEITRSLQPPAAIARSSPWLASLCTRHASLDAALDATLSALLRDIALSGRPSGVT